MAVSRAAGHCDPGCTTGPAQRELNAARNRSVPGDQNDLDLLTALRRFPGADGLGVSLRRQRITRRILTTQPTGPPECGDASNCQKTRQLSFPFAGGVFKRAPACEYSSDNPRLLVGLTLEGLVSAEPRMQEGPHPSRCAMGSVAGTQLD